MIKVYTRKKVSNCKNAIDWFEKNKIPYKEIRIGDDNPFQEQDLQQIFSLAEDIYDILSKRTKPYREIEKRIDSMSFKTELIPYIIKNAAIMKYPVSVDDNKVLTGFSEEKFTTFLTREQKRARLQECLESCREASSTKVN